MGKPKTEQVGGGAATGTANAFNDFLKQGLTTGSFGGATGPNGASTGAAQATGQSNLFGGAINGMLGGQVGDPTTYSQYFDAMKNGNGGFNGIGTGPNYQSTQFGGLSGTNSFNTLFGQNAPQFNFGGAAGSSANGAAVNFNAADYAKDANVFGANGAGQLMNYDVNSPEFAALKQLQDMRKLQDVANVRARFGAGGGSSLGSGASFAEAQYLAQANPQNTLALGELGRQMQALDMQNRGQNAQALLAQRGQNIDMRGQDVNSMLSAANNTAANQTQASIASANNNTSASIANAQMRNQGQMQQMAMQLQAMGMDADTAFRAVQTMNQNQFGENQAQNAFNQGNYQFGVNAGLQNQNQMNNFAMGQGQLGLGIMGQQGQSQQAIMNQLFGALNTSNQLGTPQSQIVQTPSTFGQIMNGLGSIANLGGNLFGQGGMFGSGGTFGRNPGATMQPGMPTFTPWGASQMGPRFY